MSTPSSRRARLSRTSVLLIAGLVLALLVAAACLGGLVGPSNQGSPRYEGLYLDNTAVLGDADGDGRLDEEEKKALERTTKSAAKIRHGLLPTKGVETLLVTPAGDDWWRLVTGLSAQTGTWAIDAPEGGVDWYAYTEGRAFKPADGRSRPYDAIHIVFKSEEAMRGWVQDAARRGLVTEAVVEYRGRVATIVPSWVVPYDEPYPEVTEKALAGIEVPIAMWQIDISEQIGLRAEESMLPDVYKKVFYDHLGFARTGATWSATSPAPDAVWRGKVTGFDPDRVDAGAALGELNASYEKCTPRAINDCGGGQGMAEAVNRAWFAQGHEGGGEPTLAPPYAPEDAQVVISLDNGFRGAVAGTYAFDDSPVGALSMWVTPDKILSIHPVLGGYPEES